MTLGEMMKYSEKIEEELKNCKISKLNSVHGSGTWHKIKYNGLEEKFFKPNFPESEREYRKLVALDNLTHVLDGNNPMEYIFTKCFIEELQLYDTYENRNSNRNPNRVFDPKMDVEKYLDKLKSLINYLGKDYQIPQDIIQNKIATNSKDYSSIFSFDDENMQEFLSNINQELLYKVIEMNKQIKTEEPILLARIMDKKEFELFQTKGVVVGVDFEGERSWNAYNKGNIGDYTFMVFRNTDDALKNITSVIPYFHLESNLENKYLVFFSTNNVKEDMCYSGLYRGRDLDLYGGLGLFGRDTSIEVALPFYDKNNFTVLSCVEVNDVTLKNIMINQLEKMNVLSLPIEDLNSKIYDDFNGFLGVSFYKDCSNINIDGNHIKNYLESHPEMGDLSNDELKEILRQKEIKSTFISKFNEYYELRCQFDEVPIMDDKYNDALECAKIIQEICGLSDEFTYDIAGEIVQKMDNWFYYSAYDDFEYDDECDEEYDEEYDEDQNDIEEDEEYLGPYAEYYEDEYYL